jgi:uncharacterized protein (TIGR03437 family)
MNQRPPLSCLSLLALFLISLLPAAAQKSTSVSLSGFIGSYTQGKYLTNTITGTGLATGLGQIAVSFTGTQNVNANGVPSGVTQGVLTISQNRLDTFNIAVSIPDPGNNPVNNFSGTITGGTGTFAGATGTANFTATNTGTSGNSATYKLDGNGSVNTNSGTKAFSFTNLSAPGFAVLGDKTVAVYNGTMSPLGSVKLTSTDIVDSNKRNQATAVFTLTSGDSINAFVSYVGDQPPNPLPSIITGGTGAFAGATGSILLTFADNSFSGTGTVIQPAAGTPIITQVNTSGAGSAIAQNTWIEIKGTNLVPANTPSGGVYWSNAPDFQSGRMPIQLGSVNVKVNGRQAYIWWFCSKTTTSFCATDQINVLTPLDNEVGQVQVVVTSSNGTSAPYMVNLQSIAPSFLLFDAPGHIVATHSDFKLLAPAALYPGASTPAGPTERVSLFAIGLGLPNSNVVDGSSTQSGLLPTKPVCTVGNTTAQVTDAALISPGLYQLNLQLATTGLSGDLPITCTYQNVATPAGNLIAVQ